MAAAFTALPIQLLIPETKPEPKPEPALLPSTDFAPESALFAKLFPADSDALFLLNIPSTYLLDCFFPVLPVSEEAIDLFAVFDNVFEVESTALLLLPRPLLYSELFFAPVFFVFSLPNNVTEDFAIFFDVISI